MSYDQHSRAGANIISRCAVITVSDTRTAATDKSGDKIRELLQTAGHLVIDSQIIKDDPTELESAVKNLLARSDVDAILTNGGTGISRRDQTISIIEKLLTQPLPGFGELFRMLSWHEIASGAMLSRAVGGIASGKLLFAMPGSTSAVELAMMKLILPEMKHLLNELRK